MPDGTTEPVINERTAMLKKIMAVFGTRPEAIKMCPLVLELRRRPGFRTVVCLTGQHSEMLDLYLIHI